MSMLTETLALLTSQTQEIERLKVWMYEALLLVPEDKREPFMRERGIILPPTLHGEEDRGLRHAD